MKKVLFVSGTSGNGGTQTWTKQYLENYKSNDFELVHVNLSARRGLLAEASLFKRIIDGLLDLREVYYDVKRVLKKRALLNNACCIYRKFGHSSGLFIGKTCKEIQSQVHYALSLWLY